MHDAITTMLEPYQCNTPEDYKNALKEIIQQIALLGLSRQGFFHKAAFYGGTALRIAHKLNRFSEDMDFTLLKHEPDFTLLPFLKGIEEELLVYDLQVHAEHIDKTVATSVDSAFIKSNTLALLLKISNIKNPTSGTHRNELIKIKIEIDTRPPIPSGLTESLFLTLPIPFSYNILTKESLFAGKLHAVLCREYPSGRIKGRDYYDFVWYNSHNIKPDLDYLKAKLIQSNKLRENEVFDITGLRKLLRAKVDTVDFKKAAKDVLPFIKDDFEIRLWSKEFFNKLIDQL